MCDTSSVATETFQIESNLEPSEAFGRLVDLLQVGEWDRGVTSPRLIDGEPATAGARYEVTVTGFDGSPTTVVYELTAVDAPRSFTMVGSHDDFRADDTITIRPTDGGCLVDYRAGLVLLGDAPPLSEEQLGRQFGKIVAVPRAGLEHFLNR